MARKFDARALTFPSPAGASPHGAHASSEAVPHGTDRAASAFLPLKPDLFSLPYYLRISNSNFETSNNQSCILYIELQFLYKHYTLKLKGSGDM